MEGHVVVFERVPCVSFGEDHLILLCFICWNGTEPRSGSVDCGHCAANRFGVNLILFSNFICFKKFR